MRRRTILGTRGVAAGIAAILWWIPAAPGRAQGFGLWNAWTNGSTHVVRTGDIDGDGLPDLLVAMPQASYGSPGQAKWISGSSGATLHLLIGAAPNDGFGSDVADAGDIDGDGLSDAIVGAPGATSFGLQQAGQARVFSGASGAVLLVLNGWNSGDQLGWTVLGLGDLTADGHADVLVGAPYADPGGLDAAGQIRVFSGSNGLVLYLVNGTWAGAVTGKLVLRAGDLDLDGSEDAIAATLPSYFFGGTQGEVRALSGDTGQTIYVHAMPPVPSSLNTLALAGDLDADGVNDWAVGLPELGSGGTLEVFSGATGSVLASLHGTATTSYGGGFGTVFGPAGDANGDGHGDLAVGIPGAMVNAVASAGEVILYSGADQSILHSLQGTDLYGALGTSLAAAGDVDGDGADDLLVGAPHPAIPAGGGPYGPWWTPNGPGEAVLFSGATGESLYAISGSSVSDYFGGRVWSFGDLSGDGRSDLIASGPVFPTMGLRCFSYTGIPGGSSLFGTGCPGGSGSTPQILAAGGNPFATVGNPTFGAFLSGAPPGASALLLMGLSSQAWGSIPLPMSLALFGMPACSLEVSADFGWVLSTNVSGNALAPLPIPADPGLAGATLYLQWLVADPGPALLPGAMSGALELVLL